ncbi:helicase-related protein [Pseudarthrobacter sp. AB1]|uniref:helicase-related protein n=1 Tax=Pseudarthrobacter sp. AB1 TaxID=2138309 RepID=UPI00186B9524|nr:helicase-related protein [Pseudarthrobacter sp. AB1]MBE4717297.1 helicase [Pseudarthrobacter sp. AB1]
MTFEKGQRIHIPGKNLPEWVSVYASLDSPLGRTIFIETDSGVYTPVELTEAEVKEIRTLDSDGGANSARVLAGMWSQWMAAAGANADTTVLASTPLRPYAHQSTAVYGAMLPQPRLRFLLADEPGTGKTIMAGLYLREMQKLGFVSRAIVVCPAGLVTKWQSDFERFFGGELRRITNETIQQHGLSDPHDMWVVSLELAAMNPAVQEAIRPDRAGWDVVVFDEAHRLTPTAETFHQVGRLLAQNTPRALLMTATPHRGSEWLFRHLLHLVDPDVYPDPGDDPKAELRPIKPGPVHFLRRMKEDLVDYDGRTRLFRGRTAHNEIVPLNAVEYAYYEEALRLVDEFFPPSAVPLARMVYGKRAASSLHSLRETLKRRRDLMGSESPAEAAHRLDPFDEDPSGQDEARVIAEGSRAAKAERKAITGLLRRLEPLLSSSDLDVSKWKPLITDCFANNGVLPGNSEQAVIFTEYADSADWIVARLRAQGFTAQRYSGRDSHASRDGVRLDFMARRFQIIVSTDAGNEGIDLQSAHVLVNYDIPWSLVRLEQRMGRIHRVGQTRDVQLYNLIAKGTREGAVLEVLLTNFVNAANQLSGKMFDSLSLVAELSGLSENRLTGLMSDSYGDDQDRRSEALRAVQAITTAQLRSNAQEAHRVEAALATTVNIAEAIRRRNAEALERINPAIIEEYLHRLNLAKVLSVVKTAAGDGILRIQGQAGPLPNSFGMDRSALIATSGKALSEAQRGGASLANVFALGPGEPSFNDLVGYARDELGPDVYRGGLVTDPTTIGDYELFAFHGTMADADQRRSTPWAALIRVDRVGARRVAWETLANLVPGAGVAGPVHPGRLLDAQSRADQLAEAEQDAHRETLHAWLAQAERELLELPSKISRDIADRSERLAVRAQMDSMVNARLNGLRRMTQVTITDVRLASHIKVKSAGIPPDPTEKDSENIAMRKVHDELVRDGFAVADVHLEGRGYDLYATRGQLQRCVEVKGVWTSAASQGIRLTGNEILTATQQRNDYWLYVIDECSNGEGNVYGVYRDPVSTFDGLIKQEAIFAVPGSALKAARNQENDT